MIFLGWWALGTTTPTSKRTKLVCKEQGNRGHLLPDGRQESRAGGRARQGLRDPLTPMPALLTGQGDFTLQTRQTLTREHPLHRGGTWMSVDMSPELCGASLINRTPKAMT